MQGIEKEVPGALANQGAQLVANTPALDSILHVLSWLVIIFGVVWFVTGVIGYMHRRAYNLIRAESDGSGPITPDFLKVDKKKREAAVERGEAYTKVLERREAERTSPKVDRFGSWARFAALITAASTLITAVASALTKLPTLQTGVEQLSSWDSLGATIRQYPVGAAVAFLVILVNIIVFAQRVPAKR